MHFSYRKHFKISVCTYFVIINEKIINKSLKQVISAIKIFIPLRLGRIGVKSWQAVRDVIRFAKIRAIVFFSRKQKHSNFPEYVGSTLKNNLTNLSMESKSCFSLQFFCSNFSNVDFQNDDLLIIMEDVIYETSSFKKTA